ncbi:hypothetical protein RND81_02G219600 [Saponaria officinalis]|uniref:RING-type E3 ubiquitin transferase n=1 Tax=Saponaria officinalis TaxID=3572 RepID=A0AAW1MYR8_SAPOF
MASEPSNTSETPQSIFERLINSRNRDLPLFFPFILGFTASVTDPGQTRVDSPDSESDPDANSGNRSSPDESTQQERIVLINPVTQTMTVIEGTGLDTLFRGVEGKGGQPPASKSAVEALPRVEIREGDDERGECVICLEEFSVGNVVKEMPCKHGFHEKCIEKWLSIHGNCPVCRCKLPVDDEEGSKKSEETESGGGDGGRGGGRVNREIWLSFSFGGFRRSGGDGGDQSQGGDQMMDID